MARLWLDATTDDPEEVANLPIPPIPEGLVKDVTTPRPMSLPPSRQIRRAKRSSKHDSSQPAAPEVISTLIDSLSMLQVPTPDQFHHWASPSGASVSTPSSPSAFQTRYEEVDTDAGSIYGGGYGSGNTARNSIATNCSMHNHSVHDGDFSSIDDAAEPPVVRTSKPPSGRSPITAPKSPRKEHGMRMYLKSGSRSATSLASFRDRDDDARSIGNISIEATTPTLPTHGGRQSSERRGSGTINGGRARSLIYMGSRERLRGKERDAERRQSTQSRDSILSISDEAVKQMLATPSIQEEREEREGPNVVENQEGKKKKRSSLRLDIRRTPSSSRSGQAKLEYGDSGSPTVPLRRSSLRHSDSPSQRKLQIQVRRSSRQIPSKTETVFEEPSNADDDLENYTSPPSTAEAAAEEGATTNADFEDVDTQVTKRIKQLKAQKVIRDREARLSADTSASMRLSAEEQLGNRTSGDVSNLGSDHSHSSSVDSWTQEDAQAVSDKAHRVLGRIHQAGDPAEHNLAEPLALGTTLPADVVPNHTYLTVSRPHTHTITQYAVRDTHPDPVSTDDRRPTTPQTPFEVPINYNFVVQSLDKVSTHSSKSSARGSFGASSSSRPLSFGAGGRSALGRQRPSQSKIPELPYHPKVPDRKTSQGAPEDVSSSSTSAKKTSTETSSTVTTKLSKPIALQPPPVRRPPPKTQRWSHPDLPLRVDNTYTQRQKSTDPSKTANKNTTSSHSTPKPPKPQSHKPKPKPEPLPELPPPASPVDPVDLAVDRFLAAPRLSRRVRHPQTGRVICFSDVGDPRGHAVFCCVGMGLTRYVAAFYDELARTLKLRLITPDRPGVGGSEGDGNSTPLNWPGKSVYVHQQVVPVFFRELPFLFGIGLFL
ncbi:hypothetical protein P152DRAFT_12034 [Eremomyces bilateralis CBS 781.70]|uniref:Uncharacterized protein n=1 Tax=Eremomyces bilateralis CBS 781.70 TaxID=1392243 RepID=A0A6G1GGW8_9PEZI|nr:uncharacterized protein P152DRAFT_12034 [Eremomyces bilateralis CBS 781.70]KAF1817232.1 hypothetical protein P152DRAFT_12034 [Eremomyces bilateralis CBS 781.70]